MWDGGVTTIDVFFLFFLYFYVLLCILSFVYLLQLWDWASDALASRLMRLVDCEKRADSKKRIIGGDGSLE